ncbi:MAG: PD40 domain-containing protein [Deltaproteobacteria bacterium]|nr:PD40 domain-containing protein [Deltaproteobacteria bacterium]
MTERDPLFDGTPGLPEVDRLQSLLAPLKTEVAPPPLPSRAPWWRRPSVLSAAATLAAGLVLTVLVAGPEHSEVGDARQLTPPAPAIGGAGQDRSLERAGTTEPADFAPTTSRPEDKRKPVPREGQRGGGGEDVAPRSTAPPAGEPEYMPLGAAPVELLTHHEGNVHHPQMSPDGSELVYEVHYPAEKRTELWLAGMEGRALAGDPVMLVPKSLGDPSPDGSGKRSAHSFGWAPTGSPHKYAYTVRDSDGSQQVYIDEWSGLIAEGVNRTPTWDPTEARFVFTSNRTGRGDLYLWDGGAELQLTFDETHAELYPSWAPAGNKIAFVRAGRGQSQVMVLDVHHLNSVPLVNFSGKDSTRPSFSPDGGRVAFLSNKGTDSVMRFGLWVVEAKPGSTARNIGRSVRIPSRGALSWTPDGRGLIGVIDAPEQGDPIAIFPIDGGPPRIVSTGTVRNRDPRLHVVDDAWRLLFTSQEAVASDRDWHRMFVYDIPR